MNEEILTLKPGEVYQRGEVFLKKNTKAFYTVKEHPELLIMRCLDIVTSDNGKEKELIPGKGAINAKISNMLFELLHGQYIDKHCSIPLKTHYIGPSMDNPAECLVSLMAQPIPLEVIIRNQAEGSFVERYGVKHGTKFEFPTCEFTQKDSERNDPPIIWDHIWALNIAAESEIKIMREVALKVNHLLGAFFKEIGIELVDFKLVFGRQINAYGDPCNLRIIGEISPDTCRLRDSKTGEILDKDIFRHGLPGLSKAYASVLQKMTTHSKYEKTRFNDSLCDGYGNSLK